jgi:hypothetical protein
MEFWVVAVTLLLLATTYGFYWLAANLKDPS